MSSKTLRSYEITKGNRDEKQEYFFKETFEMKAITLKGTIQYWTLDAGK